jgi:hypothetical protein
MRAKSPIPIVFIVLASFVHLSEAQITLRTLNSYHEAKAWQGYRDTQTQRLIALSEERTKARSDADVQGKENAYRAAEAEAAQGNTEGVVGAVANAFRSSAGGVISGIFTAKSAIQHIAEINKQMNASQA